MINIVASELPVMKSCCKTCPFKLTESGRFQDVDLANNVIQRTLFKGHQICHGTEFSGYEPIMKKFYLYKHIRIDNEEVFYVGIGVKARPYSKHNRSKFWRSIVEKTKYRVEILLETEDFELVKTKEIELITFYGRRDLGTGTLVNLTGGGEGMLNYKYTPEHLSNLSKYSTIKKKVQNVKTGEIFSSIKLAALSQELIPNSLQYELLRGTSKLFKYVDQNNLPATNKKDRKVMDKKTKKVYDNLKIASEQLNFNYNTLRNYLSTNNKKCPVTYVKLKNRKPNNRCKGSFDNNMVIYERMGVSHLVK